MSDQLPKAYIDFMARTEAEDERIASTPLPQNVDYSDILEPDSPTPPGTVLGDEIREITEHRATCFGEDDPECRCFCYTWKDVSAAVQQERDAIARMVERAMLERGWEREADRAFARALTNRILSRSKHDQSIDASSLRASETEGNL